MHRGQGEETKTDRTTVLNKTREQKPQIYSFLLLTLFMKEPGEHDISPLNL